MFNPEILHTNKIIGPREVKKKKKVIIIKKCNAEKSIFH